VTAVSAKVVDLPLGLLQTLNLFLFVAFGMTLPKSHSDPIYMPKFPGDEPPEPPLPDAILDKKASEVLAEISISFSAFALLETYRLVFLLILVVSTIDFSGDIIQHFQAARVWRHRLNFSSGLC
jgi:hypothetical protein